MYKDLLIKQVRDSSLAGNEILRVLDRGVAKLDEFTKVVSPLQDAILKFEEASSTIDKTLSQVKDLAQMAKEAQNIVIAMSSPDNTRNHLKNIIRAQQILKVYAKNKHFPDSGQQIELLNQGLKTGYNNCVAFLEEQLTKYCEIYGISAINQDQAQLDMIISIQQLIEVCQKHAPQYWNIYKDTRSELLFKNVNVSMTIPKPYVIGSHPIIKMLAGYIESLAIESQLLQMIFQTDDVGEQLAEVSDKSYSHFYTAIQQYLSSQSNIYQNLDILTAFGEALGSLEQLLGKSANYFNLSKCFTNLLHKSQS